MFDSLAEKLQGDARRCPQPRHADRGTSTRAMREIRLALLEADVNFKVVKSSPTRSRSARWAPT
jgi:signal recognition particle subunit SRP54